MAMVQWLKQGKKFLNKLGLSEVEVNRMRNAGENVCKLVRRRQADISMQVPYSQINESKYNRRYKDIKCKGVPKYLSEYNKE